MAKTIWINSDKLLYIATVDGVEHRIVSHGRLDYKATCRKYYQNGAKKVNICFIGRVV